MVSEQNSHAFNIPVQADSTQPFFTQGSRLLNPFKLELTIKLDHNNFLLWRQQIIAAIKGNCLFRFIDPNSEIPSKKKELLPQLVGCTTACEAWYTVERLFTSQSRANVMQLKLQLQTLKKSGSTMTEYLIKKKSIMDSLAYSGYILSEDDKIMYILGRLRAEYDSFVIPITSMSNTYSIPKITALLMTHEARIEQHTQTDVVSVNMASNNQGFMGVQSGQGSGNFGQISDGQFNEQNNNQGGGIGYQNGSNVVEIDQLVQRLNSVFALKDLGSLHYFLGIEVQHSSSGIHLSQNKYILDLLDKAGMKTTRSYPSPMVSSTGNHLSTYTGCPIFSPSEYRSIVGAL
ncbi:hypothetical protein LWI29_021486 [Acer saccharum]|uniref:Reverse transcriptase Ty1/copia-type domain-containing protein n=1 Tax=Acer saccharum TaxID=4024 RepID=A0AA39SZ05_ACESA|nr:hypothetical protein LWI29_021486 [Acer saccharum]